VGEGGIRFSIEHKLSTGDIVSLEILITTVSKPIIATGQVIWVKKTDNAEFPYMVGIKFIKIDSLDRCRLITYFHKLIEEGRLDEMYWLGELDKYKTEKTDEPSEE
jgi:Tfp pilus assembly protein PilZ